MAILVDGIQFTGRVANLVAYKVKGSNKIRVRRANGPTKKQILTSPNFQKTRENCDEFRECARVGSHIRKALLYVRHLADHNITPVFNKMCKAIQLLDTEKKRGGREIDISKYRYLLDGYNLNSKRPLESIVSTPLQYSVDRDTGLVEVQLPILAPGLNLDLPWPYPMYRFIVAACMLCDSGYFYDGPYEPVYAYTNWQMATQPYAGEKITLHCDSSLLNKPGVSIVLSAGIEMGSSLTDALIVPVKYAGTAKILAVR